MKGIREIKGIFTPMLTIFKKDGSIDEESTRSHVNYLIGQGIHGIIPCGSTGEFVAMTEGEKKKVIKIVIEEVGGRIPVYASTGSYSTQLTVELSQYAEEIGADGVMIITPYYLPRKEDEIYEHYKAISESIDIPIMLYHNPHFSGITLTDDFIAKCYKDGLITAVKEGEGETGRIFNLRNKTDDNFKIFYGFDETVVEALMMGADGWVAGTSNMIAKYCVKVFELAGEGDKYEEAKELWGKMKVFLDLVLYKWPDGSNPPWLALMKEGLNMIGQKGGYPRKPAFPLDKYDDIYREKLEKSLKELELM